MRCVRHHLVRVLCDAERSCACIQWISSTGSGADAVADIILTIALILSLHRSRTGVRQYVAHVLLFFVDAQLSTQNRLYHRSPYSIYY